MPQDRQPRVYVLSAPRPNHFTGKQPDTRLLHAFGEVKYMLPRGVMPEFKAEQSLNLLHEHLSKYDPDIDYIATVGGSYMGAILLGMVLRDLGHERMSFLRFDRAQKEDGTRSATEGFYVAVPVDFQEMLGELHEHGSHAAE